MNWRRGLFRLWIVASALWIALVTWVEYDGVVRPYQEAAQQQKCFDREVAKYAAFAFGPILATLVLGLGWGVDSSWVSGGAAIT